ncbi:MAG: sigma-70 family RNA polymerase sigma factor [Chloroflexi bacterium]|nr:sigma-70 family RNA polymerase sigma factor [Chloroflexota bacterium]
MPDSQLPEDATLIEQARTGSADAFGELYERYARVVFRFLYARLDGRLDAEDLTSEVFLRAWRALPRYRERGFRFSSFLLRIAHNVLVDHYRRVGRVSSLSRQDVNALQNHSTSAGEVAVRNLEQQELLQVLGRLRKNYQTVLSLRFLSELSPAETAKVMGCSEGSVRVMQHRALKALKALIEKPGEEK